MGESGKDAVEIAGFLESLARHFSLILFFFVAFAFEDCIRTYTYKNEKSCVCFFPAPKICS